MFYRIRASLSEASAPIRCAEREEVDSIYRSQSEALWQRSEGRFFLCVGSLVPGAAEFLAIAPGIVSWEAELSDFASQTGLKAQNWSREEITCRVMVDSLSKAEYRDYITSSNEILNAFGLRELGRRVTRGLGWREQLVAEGAEPRVLRRQAEQLGFGTSLPEELPRVFSRPRPRHSPGHPVHYLLRTDDSDMADAAATLLVSALYRVGRLRSRRLACVDISQDLDADELLELRSFYLSCKGSTLMLRLQDEQYEEERFAAKDRLSLHSVCSTLKDLAREVLLIVSLPRSALKAYSGVTEYLPDRLFIPLEQASLNLEQARGHLERCARTRGVEADDRLLAQLRDQNGWRAEELDGLLERWFAQKLRNEVYPQYATLSLDGTPMSTSVDSASAYDCLQRMVGLTAAKQVIDLALAYHQVERLRQPTVSAMQRPGLHLCFTGNPGTAKTSVARLFARILRERGVLSVGDLVEVGRADLVGRYVGWTARLVKQAFLRAKGSVLFVDEAYALLDGREGLYGEEAINTLVQEMENAREDCVVILAGYPGRMEALLDSNPGLRSRISFHVPFEDYSAPQLMAILRLMAADSGLRLPETLEAQLLPQLEIVSRNRDFGNGRHIRNLFEQAKYRQALRLSSQTTKGVTPEELLTLEPADSCEEMLSGSQQPRPSIGF